MSKVYRPMLEALKQQIEMEKNLSYGDSFNFFSWNVDNDKDLVKESIDKKENS